MQDSFSELIKLLLPEIIVDYFELTSVWKRRRDTSFIFKEISPQRVPTE
jgi:hypothetical protein